VFVIHSTSQDPKVRRKEALEFVLDLSLGTLIGTDTLAADAISGLATGFDKTDMEVQTQLI